MNQAPANQAGAQPNGMGAGQQQPLANSVSPAAVQVAQKSQFIKIDAPYQELRLELRRPIVFEGKQYTQMVFREVTLSDLTLLNESEDQMLAQIQVFSAMTNNQVPQDVFNLMPAREVGKIMNFLEECLDGFPQPGSGIS